VLGWKIGLDLSLSSVEESFRSYLKNCFVLKDVLWVLFNCLVLQFYKGNSRTGVVHLLSGR
jgi:hypothetical protein